MLGLINPTLTPSLSPNPWSLLFHSGDKSDSALLEKLRLERKAKIDELKEKTNYYATQQLIQVKERGLLLISWTLFWLPSHPTQIPFHSSDCAAI